MGESASQTPAEDAAKPSPWNSLEISRLVMAAATPLALFAIGFLVTQQVERQEKREKASQAEAAKQREDRAEAARLTRESQIRKETAARESEARQAAAQLQRELRDLADERERQLRREGFAREEALRNDAARREEAVRNQALALSQSSKLIERRIEFWDKLAPKFAQIDRIIDRILVGEGDPDQLEVAFREIDDLFGLYRPYFSSAFEDDYEHYQEKVRAFLDLSRTPGTLLGLAVSDGAISVCQSYFRLRQRRSGSRTRHRYRPERFRDSRHEAPGLERMRTTGGECQEEGGASKMMSWYLGVW